MVGKRNRKVHWYVSDVSEQKQKPVEKCTAVMAAEAAATVKMVSDDEDISISGGDGDSIQNRMQHVKSAA